MPRPEQAIAHATADRINQTGPMRRPHLIAPFLAITLLAAACAQEPTPSPRLGSIPAVASSSALPGPQVGTGTLDYEVSGALTIKGDLALAMIELEPGSARLLYGSDTGDAQYLQLDVSSGLSGVVAAGGALTTSGSTLDTCTFTIDKLDATRVSGSFDCPDLTFRDPTKGDIGKGRVKGTFEAGV
ncbi:MAG TPA: hypothetical protein VK600_04470 [Candidatus Saccharimonadales bacterium]|nr:hypothetical protein [Candidatus Saccharimonadales bacterium]